MIDVESVCTDKDLEKHTLGASNLQAIIPGEWAGSAAIARGDGLERVLTALKRRRPPIYEDDLADPTELKNATAFAALQTLYLGAITHEDSPYKVRAKHFGDRYSQEINSLQPTVHAGSTAGSLTIRMSRG